MVDVDPIVGPQEGMRLELDRPTEQLRKVAPKVGQVGDLVWTVGLDRQVHIAVAVRRTARCRTEQDNPGDARRRARPHPRLLVAIMAQPARDSAKRRVVDAGAATTTGRLCPIRAALQRFALTSQVVGFRDFRPCCGLLCILEGWWHGVSGLGTS